MKDEEVDKLKAKYLDESHFDTLIDFDCDGYDVYGNLLFKYRKNRFPLDKLKLGYESFKKSIIKTTGRGIAAGGYKLRERKDGSIGKFRSADEVTTGCVGFLDPRVNPEDNYCRMTNFGREYFEEYQAGIPFVQEVDKQYRELVPDAWRRQKDLAEATNKNYVIPDTSFTTVTVNKTFQTSCHQDSGDYKDGFGNLIVYNDGSYHGGYFVLPQYRVAIDMQSTDILFVDVHKWHGNTPMKLKEGFDEIFRISFVLYYRENMVFCKQPSEAMKELNMKHSGFDKL